MVTKKPKRDKDDQFEELQEQDDEDELEETEMGKTRRNSGVSRHRSKDKDKRLTDEP